MLSVESLIAGCGDIVTYHESFGKVFRTFQYGASLRGTDNRDVLGAQVGFKVIVDTFYQWVLRTYYYHINAFLYTELLNGFEVVGLHADILTAVACSCVTWCNKQFLTFLTLSDFPCESMLASATA